MSEQPIVVVAMSGGLDSSTVAASLVKEGHRVVGMTMQLWNQRRLPEIATDAKTGRCCSLDDVYDARHVAEQIGIPFYVVNFEKQFEENVVVPFVEDYLAGRTPIPCTLCNNFIKFDKFLEMADTVGAEKVATGHYARVEFNEATGRYEMRTGADLGKDQTYFLFGLTQQQLSRCWFPIGDKSKKEVRDMARDMGLAVAEKAESYEICFVPNGDYAAFIDAYQREQGIAPTQVSGDIVDQAGHALGQHGGVHHFTVGQRRGLGVAVGEPLYVIETNPATQKVTVGAGESLLRQTLIARDVNWVAWPEIKGPERAEVKIRNRHLAAPATISPAEGGRVKVEFDQPQRAVTPGQAAVFYDGDLVLGGGWIE
jgi:tRNA-specific 2-thiouridylase